MTFDPRWLTKMAANLKMTLTMLFAASSYTLWHEVLSESSDDEADFKNLNTHTGGLGSP